MTAIFRYAIANSGSSSTASSRRVNAAISSPSSVRRSASVNLRSASRELVVTLSSGASARIDLSDSPARSRMSWESSSRASTTSPSSSATTLNAARDRPSSALRMVADNRYSEPAARTSPSMTAFRPSRKAISRATPAVMGSAGSRPIRCRTCSRNTGSATVITGDSTRSMRSVDVTRSPISGSLVAFSKSARMTMSASSMTPWATRLPTGPTPVAHMNQ